LLTVYILDALLKFFEFFKLAAYRAAESGRIEAQVAIFREQPHAKVIVISNATHFIFLSRIQAIQIPVVGRPPGNNSRVNT
jgi:hypothetical protein